MSQNASQAGSSGPQRGLPPRWAWFIAFAAIALIGLAGIITASQLRNNAPVEDSTSTPTDAFLRELGSNYSAGFIDGAKIPAERAAAEMYGQCVLKAQQDIIPRYGDSGAQAWLVGCLTYARNLLPPVSDTPPTP